MLIIVNQFRLVYIMPSFVLLRWIGEESMSVRPQSTIKKGHKVFLGAFTYFKWGGKYYEAEVLALSGNLYAEIDLSIYFIKIISLP